MMVNEHRTLIMTSQNTYHFRVWVVESCNHKSILFLFFTPSSRLCDYLNGLPFKIRNSIPRSVQYLFYTILHNLCYSENKSKRHTVGSTLYLLSI